MLTSGAHRVDTSKVAQIIGVDTVKRAKPDFVREHTGQPIGGVAPVGHPKQIRALMDTTLAQYGELWAGAGIAPAVFPIAYAELVRITSATPIEVA